MRVSTIISDIVQIINRKHSDLQGLDADDHLQYDRVDGTRHYIKNLLTTQGDLLIRGANGLERLPIGEAGKVLKSQGPGANPVWADIPIPTKFVRKFTAGEFIHRYRAVCIKSDGKIYEAGAESTERLSFIGFVNEDVDENSETDVYLIGCLDGFTNLETGKIYFLQDSVVEIDPKYDGNSNTEVQLPSSPGAWQSFTAVGNKIQKIEVYLRNASTVSATAYLQLKEGEGLSGANVGPQLSKSLAVSFAGWVSFEYTIPVKVSSNSVYSIVLWDPSRNIYWKAYTLNPYPGGRSSADPNYDNLFRVYKIDMGLIGTTQGTNRVKVGTAISSSDLLIMPSQ